MGNEVVLLMPPRYPSSSSSPPSLSSSSSSGSAMCSESRPRRGSVSCWSSSSSQLFRIASLDAPPIMDAKTDRLIPLIQSEAVTVDGDDIPRAAGKPAGSGDNAVRSCTSTRERGKTERDVGCSGWVVR
jgi:hypothetical protein